MFYFWQVRGCADLANKAVEEGMCVVIGLQSTGEANTNQMRDEQGDDLEDFISAPKQILYQFLSKHFPLNSCDMTGYELDILQHQVCKEAEFNMFAKQHCLHRHESVMLSLPKQTPTNSTQT